MKKGKEKENMREVLVGFPDMIEKSMELGKDIKIEGEIKNIFVLGMGGSGFSGDLLKTYLHDLEIPIFVNKGYEVPKYATRDSLIFAVSYSGNTEETVSAYRMMIRRGAKNIVAITSGGKLEELSNMNSNPIVTVPAGIQPRLSTPYLLTPMLNIMANSGLIEDRSEDLREVIKSINVESIEKRAQELALKMKGKIPVIYSSDRLFSVAEKWKTDINENAKTMCFYNVFPEFNHNETNAYINMTAKAHVVMIKDVDDHDRVKKRFSIIKKLIMSKGVDVTEIAITGSKFLSRLLSSIYLGSWVGFYLALEYKTDPTPVPIIEDLKMELKK